MTNAMRKLMSLQAAALLVTVGVSAATAQQNQAPSPAQQQQDQAKPAQSGAEEPSSRVPTAAPEQTAVFINGKLAVPGAPENSQTEPAKFSQRNAALDSISTMARPLTLTDDEKHRIMASVAKANVPIARISAKPADVLPSGVTASDLPADVANIPTVKDLKYVRLADKIVLVSTPNMVVTGEIAN